MSRYPTAWRVMLTSQDRRFMVKGFALAATLYGPASRFCVFEVRTFEDGHAGVRYRVHDAHAISDADVAAGKSVPAIAHGLTWDEVDELVERLVSQDAARAATFASLATPRERGSAGRGAAHPKRS